MKTGDLTFGLGVVYKTIHDQSKGRNMLTIHQKLGKRHSVCICHQCGLQYVCDHYDAAKSRVGHLCDACKDIITNAIQFTQQDLLNFFQYDPVTGDLTHRLDTRRCKAGSPATYKHSQGYLNVTIGGKEYLAHRVIWFMQTGIWPDQVDHENHVRDDNRWSNLKAVSGKQNQQNMGKKVSNSSGVNGVRILPSGRFCAYTMVNRKQISLGTFDTLYEAEQARLSADRYYGFHANHGK